MDWLRGFGLRPHTCHAVRNRELGRSGLLPHVLRMPRIYTAQPECCKFLWRIVDLHCIVPLFIFCVFGFVCFQSALLCFKWRSSCWCFVVRTLRSACMWRRCGWRPRSGAPVTLICPRASGNWISFEKGITSKVFIVSKFKYYYCVCSSIKA